MTTELTISRMLLQAAIETLESRITLKRVEKDLARAESALKGGLFSPAESTPKDSENEAANQLLTQAKKLLAMGTDDYDEEEADSLRKRMS